MLENINHSPNERLVYHVYRGNTVELKVQHVMLVNLVPLVQHRQNLDVKHHVQVVHWVAKRHQLEARHVLLV